MKVRGVECVISLVDIKKEVGMFVVGMSILMLVINIIVLLHGMRKRL